MIVPLLLDCSIRPFDHSTTPLLRIISILRSSRSEFRNQKSESFTMLLFNLIAGVAATLALVLALDHAEARRTPCNGAAAVPFVETATLAANTGLNRIFIIGFNKVGSHSLFEFFRANNVPGVHKGGSGEASIAASIAQRAKRGGDFRVPLLDDTLFPRHCALHMSDMESLSFTKRVYVAMEHFRRLDDENPGSKFILNVRSRSRWVQSRLEHWRVGCVRGVCVCCVDERDNGHSRVVIFNSSFVYSSTRNGASLRSGWTPQTLRDLRRGGSASGTTILRPSSATLQGGQTTCSCSTSSSDQSTPLLSSHHSSDPTLAMALARPRRGCPTLDGEERRRGRVSL